MTKTWLVTGCSSGFGRSLCELLLSRGDQVLMTVRKLDTIADLREKYPKSAGTFLLDVANIEQIPGVIDNAQAQFGKIDILVNNAGYALFGGIEEASSLQYRSIFETNFFGAVEIMRAVLPGMRARRRGHIINMSSMAGISGGLAMGYYAATKFALTAVSESLALESAHLGIKVTLIEPGAHRTGARTNWQTAAPISDYQQSIGAVRQMLNAGAGKEPGSPQKVAEAIAAIADAETPPLHLPLGKDALMRAEKKSPRYLATSTNGAIWYCRPARRVFDCSDIKAFGRLLMNTTLEGKYYSDPAIFQLETDRIFRHSWEIVGQERQVAHRGSYIATEIAGVNVFVIRGEDGKLRAFRNMCRHRGARLLSPGVGTCAEIKCRYHDWRYDDRGDLRDTPWYGDATPFDLKKLGLYPIHVETWRGLIFLALEPSGALIEQLEDLPEYLAAAPLESFSIAASRSFTVSINWKVYIDQFCEAYHVPTTHSPDKAVDMKNYRTTPHRGMMLMETISMDAANAASYYGGKWIWVWPNWTLSLFDGGMKTSRVKPLSPSQTLVHYDFYFADMTSEGAAKRERVVDATTSIFKEDIDGCLLVQANLAANSFHSGPLHPELEQAVAYFQGRIREAVG